MRVAGGHGREDVPRPSGAGTRGTRGARGSALIAVLLIAAGLAVRPAADGRHRQLLREMNQIAEQLSTAGRPEYGLQKQWADKASDYNRLPYEEATSECWKLSARAFGLARDAAGLREMKHPGADELVPKVRALIAQSNRCLGDEFNTRSEPEPDRGSRPGAGDRIDTGGAPPRGGGRRPSPSPAPPRGDGINSGGYDPCKNPVPPPGCPGTPSLPPSPPPSRPPLSAQVERVCDLQRLAQWIFRRYKTARPIARIRLANAAEPTYLLLFAGMEYDKLGQANSAGQAFVAWGNMQGFDAYRLAIFNALADLPRGTNLILAGHSQGGMEAQGIVGNLVERWGYRVRQVISYGAPIIAGRTPGTSYQHVRALDDPLIALDRVFNLSAADIVLANRRSADPHQCYPEPESGLSVYRVPAVSTLKTPCYELDLTTLEEFEAPNLFSVFLGAPNRRTVSRTPVNPGRDRLPIDLEVNCFWAALAQDRLWRTGVPIPARCELRPMTSPDIQAALARWHGHKRIDDGHGQDRARALQRHWDGEPVATDRATIEHTLPVGGQALIFVRDAMNPHAQGHVFNARRIDRTTMEYLDGQQGTDATFRFAPGYNFWMYRTQ